MAQFWCDAKGYAAAETPDWFGAAPSGVEMSSPGGFLLLNDSRGAPAYNRSLQLIASALSVEALFRFRVLRHPALSLQLGGLGLTVRYQDADNFLEMSVGSGTSWQLGNIRERLVGNSDDTQVAALYASGEFEWRYVRMKVVANQAQMRGWAEGQPEPATWALTHTLTGTPTAGAIQLLLPYANGGCWLLDYCAIGTNGDAPPSTVGLSQFSGVVTDEFGNPVSREVRLYHRGSGELIGSTVSSGVSGAFSMHSPRSGDHYITVIGADSPVVETDYSVRTTI